MIIIDLPKNEISITHTMPLITVVVADGIATIED